MVKWADFLVMRLIGNLAFLSFEHFHDVVGLRRLDLFLRGLRFSGCGEAEKCGEEGFCALVGVLVGDEWLRIVF